MLLEGHHRLPVPFLTAINLGGAIKQQVKPPLRGNLRQRRFILPKIGRDWQGLALISANRVQSGRERSVKTGGVATLLKKKVYVQYMTTPENAKPKRKLKKWQITLLVILVLYVIGSLSGNNSSSNSSSTSTTTASAPKVDVGTRMACEHWRINLSNASVETTEQQIAGAQKVWKYASVSTNPEIVSSAKAMTEAMINQDSAAYLEYGSAFGSACVAVGQ